ncbi:MAG: 1,4-alpha-glucan branching protein, partial [Dinghuibacter sp.]|nr:1,4-alpha-glucan branching protein [Dinghuibacter sp.]
LPRLKEMGVEVIWLMPVHPIGIKNRKDSLGSYYSIRDYKAVNPEFGTIDDFKQLVQKTHELGMKLIIDWVANHTSWDHVWMTSNPEFYHKNEKGEMHTAFDWADVAQLDHQNPAQQNAMIDAMKFWVTETGLDGFRCDMAHLCPVTFWEKARKTLDSIRPLFWLGETQDAPYFSAFDVIYGWEWLHKMEDYYKGKTNIPGLDSVLNQYMADYKRSKFRILFTTNHDENSWNGTEFERYGNGARAFAALCATLPGMPLVYSGQEEPLKKRLAFFVKDTIPFNNYEWKSFFTTLLQLRKNNPALRADSATQYIRLNTTANDKVFAFLRKSGEHEVAVFANLSATEKLTFSVADDRFSGKFKNAMNNAENDFSSEKDFMMGAWDFVVYVK